jgi:hypothetical protein
MALAEYAHYDALGLAELVAKKQVTPLELAEEAIARIEKHNPTLNAVVRPLYDYGRGIAAAPGDGPFRGVPFLLKDILGNVAGVPTQSGARFMVDLPSPQDDTLVVRFKAAGLVPLAKTNVPEFGLLPTTEGVLYGAAHNPWNLRHSTGGSSGGSAAAVAAGIVPMAHANDGGGSIRIPASCCGLVGLKPTRGRNPLGPMLGDIASGGLICRGSSAAPCATPRRSSTARRAGAAIRTWSRRRRGRLPRRHGRRRVACGSRSRPATPPARSFIRNASPPSRPPPACARSSATSSKRRRHRSTRTR